MSWRELPQAKTSSTRGMEELYASQQNVQKGKALSTPLHALINAEPNTTQPLGTKYKITIA